MKPYSHPPGSMIGTNDIETARLLQERTKLRQKEICGMAYDVGPHFAYECWIATNRAMIDLVGDIQNLTSTVLQKAVEDNKVNAANDLVVLEQLKSIVMAIKSIDARVNDLEIFLGRERR